MHVEPEFWKNEKTKCVAKWVINTPEVSASARNFVLENPDAPVVYRAWIKSAGMQKLKTPDGVELLDLELHFGQLSEVLLTLRFN